MPEKIIDKDNKEHEILTQNEIDALIKEGSDKAVAQAKEELERSFNEKVSAKETELTTLKSELQTAREAMEKAGKGTTDWAEARNLIKTLESKVETLTKERTAEKEQFSKEIRSVRESVFKGQIDAMVENLSGDDKDLKDKLLFHYNRLAGDVNSEKEAAEKLKDAYLLATGKQAPNPLNVARGGGGGNPPRSNEPASQELSELASNFGLKKEEIEKYSKKSQEKKAKRT